MKKANTTNVVPGIIAAEVVLLTVKTFAARLPAADQSSQPAQTLAPHKAAPPFLFVEALQNVIGLLRRWFFGPELDITQRASVCGMR